MKHPAEEVWKRYAAAEAMSDMEQEACDAHLEQDCSECWSVYTRCLEACAAEVPGMPDEAGFRDRLMLRWDQEHDPTEKQAGLTIPAESTPPEAGTKREWLRHPLFHYTAAAAITLLLMSSGLFHSLTGQVEGAASPPGQDSSGAVMEERTPFSEKLLDRTTRVIDSIEPKRERGEQS